MAQRQRQRRARAEAALTWAYDDHHSQTICVQTEMDSRFSVHWNTSQNTKSISGRAVSTSVDFHLLNLQCLLRKFGTRDHVTDLLLLRVNSPYFANV